MKRMFYLAAIAAVVVGHSVSAQAAGLEFGVGSTSDSTMTYRLGLTSDWDKKLVAERYRPPDRLLERRLYLLGWRQTCQLEQPVVCTGVCV